MLPLFHNINRNIAEIFSLRNILLQIIACLLTYLIVVSGFDWEYFKFAQSSFIKIYLMPAVGIGGLVPIFGIPILYIYSKFKKDKNLLTTMWALSQAMMLGWILSSIYKAFTGRIQPDVVRSLIVDTSRDWNFGFLQHGIFWGWPSSHTAVAFAMAGAIIALYPKKNVVLYTAIFYAFYIGLGVSMRIHWFSEFIAGAIIGSIVGIIVGKSFRTKLH